MACKKYDIHTYSENKNHRFISFSTIVFAFFHIFLHFIFGFVRIFHFIDYFIPYIDHEILQNDNMYVLNKNLKLIYVLIFCFLSHSQYQIDITRCRVASI